MKKILGYLAVVLLLQCPASVVAAAEALTSAGNTADFADYRIDNGGNLHLVWHDTVVDGGAVMYKLFDSTGFELIPAVQVNTPGSGMPSSWPAISVDAAGLAYVVWQDATDGEIYFQQLNPALAPLDGTAVMQGDINVLLADARLSTAGGNNAIHPRMRIDANGDLHVVWESNTGTVEYAKVNPVDGTLLNGPLSLGIVTSGTGLPDVDVDTAGHAHIVFGSDVVTPAAEIYYAMVDGDPAAPIRIRIDPTPLTGSDNLLAGSATVNVDTFDNTLYIVFKQVLINPGPEEIFMARLNPALDDQNGDDADPAVIKLFEQQITNVGGMPQWHVTSRIGSDQRIHATYIDSSCAAATPYAITDAHITLAGNVVTRQTLTTTGVSTGSPASCFPQARSAPRLNRIVWTDSMMAGIPEIYSSTFTRAEFGDSGFACSLGRRDGSAWQAGELWLLLGLLSLLGVRHLRRRG
ncbi:MAG: hypothetical protein KJO66_08315 [Gammaproteobacteria bacterium]|nr:hypothetical protein [Gammaproteobacteria bacterium]